MGHSIGKIADEVIVKVVKGVQYEEASVSPMGSVPPYYKEFAFAHDVLHCQDSSQHNSSALMYSEISSVVETNHLQREIDEVNRIEATKCVIK